MAGGVQGSGSRVSHGLPRVPHDVTQAHVLRRYLQSLRDALNEWRWLFSVLGGLTTAERDRLSAALITLAQAQQDNQNLQVTLVATQTALTQAQTDILALRVDLTVAQNAATALTARVDCLNGVTAGTPCP